MAVNLRRIKAIEGRYKKVWLALNPYIPETSGIYILFRTENGIKYGYVGQAKSILGRLAQHFGGYQHIDKSLKKHGLWSQENPTGWNVRYHYFPENELDEREQFYIKEMASKGYQMRNKTVGGQHGGKYGMDTEQSTKGYRDGIAQGKKTTLKAIKVYFDKYLDVVIQEPSNKIKERKLNEFKELLKESENNAEGSSQDIQD